MNLREFVRSKEPEILRLESRRAELEGLARAAPPPRDFAKALTEGGAVTVIAEFKRRSPSAGVLAGGADVAETVRGYAAGGAAALSVLTDTDHFGGSLADLEAARRAAELPVLRKDFHLDPLQLLEARAAGADAALLIARLLEGERLAEMVRAALEAGLEPLVEVHAEDELERALGTEARVVGVNARDLDRLEVDLVAARRLLTEVPPDWVAVAESGIRSAADVRAAAGAGADAVLVGGSLMRSGDPREAVRALAGVPRRPVRAAPGAGAGR